MAAAVVAILSVGAAIWQPWSEQPTQTVAEQVLRAPDAERVSVDLGGTGRTTLVRSVEQGSAVLVTEDLASAPEGITIEPTGGSPEPTTEPIALFDFSKAV